MRILSVMFVSYLCLNSDQENRTDSIEGKDFNQSNTEISNDPEHYKSTSNNNKSNIFLKGNHRFSVTCGGMNIGSIAYTVGEIGNFVDKKKGWIGFLYFLRTNFCYEYHRRDSSLGLIARCTIFGDMYMGLLESDCGYYFTSILKIGIGMTWKYDKIINIKNKKFSGDILFNILLGGLVNTGLHDKERIRIRRRIRRERKKKEKDFNKEERLYFIDESSNLGFNITITPLKIIYPNDLTLGFHIGVIDIVNILNNLSDLKTNLRKTMLLSICNFEFFIGKTWFLNDNVSPIETIANDLSDSEN